MKYSKNESGQNVATFNAKLISVANNIRTNSNGTEYRFGVIEFEDEGGIMHQVTTSIYEKSYQQEMKEGNSYLTTATETDKGIFVQTSHLINADFASADMFDFTQVKSESKVNEVAVADVFGK
jgi:hypothetical protein